MLTEIHGFDNVVRHGGKLLETQASKVICHLPHGHRVEIVEMEQDVAVVMYYPTQDNEKHGVALESVMK